MKDGASGGGALAEYSLTVRDAARVQSDHRLIDDKDLGIVHQGGGQDDALLHAVGIALGKLRGELRDVQAGQNCSARSAQRPRRGRTSGRQSEEFAWAESFS